MHSGFHHYHPYVQFIYYMFSGVLIMYYNHPAFLLMIVVLLIGVNLTHDKGKALRKWLWPLLLMGTLFTLLNPFLVSRGTHVLFYFRGKQVTLEALVYGMTMSLAIVGVMILFVSFNLVLNGNRFLYIFAKVLPRSAFLVMLSIRFIPLVRRRLQEITDVQRMRGASLTTGSWRSRLTDGMAFLKILLTWSLEEAIQTADSMKVRGYGIGKKTAYIPWVFGRRDYVAAAFLLLTFIICLGTGFLGYGKIIIYPQLGTLQFYLLDWLACLSMVLLIGFPIIAEGRERMKWHN